MVLKDLNCVLKKKISGHRYLQVKTTSKINKKVKSAIEYKGNIYNFSHICNGFNPTFAVAPEKLALFGNC